MEEIILAVSSVIQFIGNHAFGINILLAITIVFFERRDPRTIWAWLLVLYFIPVLGFFLYLLIGRDMRKIKLFKNKELEDALQEILEQTGKGEVTGGGTIQNPRGEVAYCEIETYPHGASNQT